MNRKQARKLWNYFCDTTSESSPNIYVIHSIDSNGEVFNVINIEELIEEYGGFKFTFSQGDEVFQLWEEEINESEIFVFKQINWNKL